MRHSSVVATAAAISLTSVTAHAAVITLQGTLTGQSQLTRNGAISSLINEYTFQPVNISGTVTSATEMLQIISTPIASISGADQTTVVRIAPYAYFSSPIVPINVRGSALYGPDQSVPYDVIAKRAVGQSVPFALLGDYVIEPAFSTSLGSGLVSDIGYGTSVTFISGNGNILNGSGVTVADQPFAATVMLTVNYTPSAVPEPMSLPILGGILVGMTALRRRSFEP